MSTTPYTGRVIAALEESGLPAAARHVLLTVICRAESGSGEVGAASPSLSALARSTGLGRSTVARELARLESAGWLIRDRPGSREAHPARVRTTFYTVRLPGRPPADTPGSRWSATGPAAALASPAAGPVTASPGPGRTARPASRRSSPTPARRCPHGKPYGTDGSGCPECPP